MGRVLTDEKHPNGLFGPGKVKYYPSMDTGSALKSAPIIFNLSDQQVNLKEQECFTRDWKLIKINTMIVFRIFKPVHSIVNVQDPVTGTMLICDTILRDIAARTTFKRMFENKKDVCEEIKVENKNQNCKNDIHFDF